MRKETAQLIVNAARYASVYAELRDEYSGRGMNGENTCGVVYDTPGDLMLCIAEAAYRLGQDAEEDRLKRQSFQDLFDELRNHKHDNMGLSYIIY